MDTLFSHVSIVTMDDRMSVWTDSFLGVTDGKISWGGRCWGLRSVCASA